MLLRYTASSDNTIVSAYQQNLTTRGTGSNAGMADIVEVFSIYARQTGSADKTGGSQELSRYIIKFPLTTLISDRSAGIIPNSGSVNFYLRMFNAQTSRTVPIEYKLIAHKLTQDWQEGTGLDLNDYKDLVKGGLGSDWVQASKGTDWTTVGGSYSTTPNEYFEQTFATGLEDLSINITPLAEAWMGGAPNYGMLVKLAPEYEGYYSSSTGANTGSLIHNPDGAMTSYYTKRLFARGTQYFFKRPVLELRWNDVIRDDRSTFFYSSSRAPAADNLNTLYFYNMIRGRLANIPSVGAGEISVSLYSGSSADSAPSGSKLVLYNGSTSIVGGQTSTGIYSCSIALTSAATPIVTLYDVWHSGGVEYYTGSIQPKTIDTGFTSADMSYYLNVKNMKEFYSNKEMVRFNLYSREKDWQPTIYTVANSTPEVLPILSASYRVYRIVDGYEAISYGTGSEQHTVLSYDKLGNYFKLDMSLLDSGFAYALKFAVYDSVRKSWIEQNETFKFKVAEF